MNTETPDDAGTPRPPAFLGKAGRAEWRRLRAQYDFAPGEVGLLTEYCANVDVITLLRAELAAGPLTVHSPQAGDVINRAVAEIRACVGEMRKLAELLRFREIAVKAEVRRFPGLNEADVMKARPVVGLRDARSHRRRAS